MLSKVCGGEDVNKSSVLSGINGSKRVMRMWRMMKSVVIQVLTELMKMLLCIQIGV
jgi:hypothetical protein